MDNIAEEIKMIQPLSLKQKSLNQILCDYSDTYVLVTGDIEVADVATDTNVAF